jgi:hypothetical protein
MFDSYSRVENGEYVLPSWATIRRRSALVGRAIELRKPKWKEDPLSALTVSAAAWVPKEPTPNIEFSKGEEWFFDWTVYAEVSVSTDSGEGLSKLSKGAWHLHLMFEDGQAYTPAFTVTNVSSGGNAPGFYLVKFKPQAHGPWLIRPTAVGVAISRGHRPPSKEADRGQVVAPVFLVFESVELSYA